MLRLKPAGIFKKVCEAIKDVTHNVYFDLTEKGLFMRFLHSSSSGVAWVEMLLQSDYLEDYRSDHKVSMPMNMNINDVYEIFDGDHNDYNGVIALMSITSGFLAFNFEDSIMCSNMQSSDAPPLSVPPEYRDLANLEFHARVKMPALKFEHICAKLGLVDKTVDISVKEDEVEFSTGSLTSFCVLASVVCKQTSIDKSEDELKCVEIQTIKPVSLALDVKHLKLSTKATPLSNTTTLTLYPGKALVVEYHVGNIGYAKYHLPHQEDKTEEV
ncbi:hypothetical protein ABFS83_06G149600 [Erythranthe nasuta]